MVTTQTGQSVITSADRFTYCRVRCVTGITPGVGPSAGWHRGDDLRHRLRLGRHDIRNVWRERGLERGVFNVDVLYRDAPAGAGTVDVSVTTVGGVSATGPADTFSYTLPAVTGLSISRGRSVVGQWSSSMDRASSRRRER